MSNKYFMMCLTSGIQPDFEFMKVYQAEDDEMGSESGMIRIWNECGENYLYPKKFFEKVELTKQAKETIFTELEGME